MNEYVIFHFSGAQVSDDGRYVLIIVNNGCDPVNKLYYVDLEKISYKIEGVLTFYANSRPCHFTWTIALANSLVDQFAW